MSAEIVPVKIFREPVDCSDISCYIRGVGIFETMPFGIVNRPRGTGDWLLMYFHDSVFIKSSDGINMYPGGSWIIWSDNDEHYYGREDVEWMHSWIHFDGQVVNALINDSGFKTNTVMTLDSVDDLLQSLSYLSREIIEESGSDAIILQNLFQNLLRKLARQVGLGEFRQGIPQGILKIKTKLEIHPVSRYTISGLAKEASMSIPHFCAEFKKYVGTSPIEYQIRIRLQQARYLLYDLNLSISEIAARAGYLDIFYFSKQFKKHYGISPSFLRKQ